MLPQPENTGGPARVGALEAVAGAPRAETYVPGFTNSLAAANPPPAAAPAVPAATPVAPVVPAAAPAVPAATPITAAPAAAPAPAVTAITNPFPDIPAINPVFIGTGLGGAPTQQQLDLRIDPATGLMLNKQRTVELDEAGRVVREVTPEGSMPGVYFSDDRGMPATTGLGKDARFTPLDPNAVYTVVNERTKEVVSTGTGAEGLKAAQLASSKLSDAGRKADWAVVKTDPTTGKDSIVANVDPRQSPLGKFADVVLPAALGFAVPGLGLVASPALGAGLGAAAGSALSSVAQGRSLGDTLLRAGITGVTAGGLAGAGNAIGGSLGSSGASGVGGSLGGALAAAGPAAQAALNATLPGIVVSGALGSALGSTVGAGLGSVAGSALGAAATGGGQAPAPRPAQPAQPPQQPPQQPEGSITVTAPRPTPPLAPVMPAVGAALGSAAGSALGAAATGGGQAPAPTPEPEIVVTAPPRTPALDIVAGALPGLGAGLPAVIPETIGNPIEVVNKRPVEEKPATPPLAPVVVPPVSPSVPETIGKPIEVTADRDAQKDIDAATAASAVAGALPTGGALPSGQTPTDGEATLETDKGILDKLQDRLGNLSLADYLRLSGLLLPLLDGGGGGRSGSRTIPADMFGGSSIFGGGLPRATLPGASTDFAPRTAADLAPKTTQDWYRYGYGPEQSFFSYVPKGEENKSQAYTGYAVGGMAGGGMRGAPRSSFAVNGPGTGRSDEIPAMLSDGEYVIDAETVALLGDGSSKAGADRLDQFRANVRKHKGRHLAKGDFSVNAKRPEHYLKGGRA